MVSKQCCVQQIQANQSFNTSGIGIGKSTDECYCGTVDERFNIKCFGLNFFYQKFNRTFFHQVNRNNVDLCAPTLFKLLRSKMHTIEISGYKAQIISALGKQLSQRAANSFRAPSNQRYRLL